MTDWTKVLALHLMEPVDRPIEWDQVPFFADECVAAANAKPWR